MQKILMLGGILICASLCIQAQVKPKTTKPPVAKTTTTNKTGPIIQTVRGGLQYKLFPSSQAAPLAKSGDIVKFHYAVSINDSVMYSTYDKVPGYVKLNPTAKPAYDLTDILPKMKRGDSAVTIQNSDSLRKRGMQLPPSVKPGAKVFTNFRILQVFTVDSIARADYAVENEKDRPRQEREQAAQMEEFKKARKIQQEQEDLQLQQSGEMAREFKEVEDYLAAKKITAQKTGKGIYVRIDEPGDGAQVADGKFITVEYTGKHLLTDSVFQSNTYTFPIGQGEVIRGWDEGLLAFKKGGKGTLYIPGFMAYGANPPQGSPFKPFEPLIFDVRIVDVRDQP